MSTVTMLYTYIQYVISVLSKLLRSLVLPILLKTAVSVACYSKYLKVKLVTIYYSASYWLDSEIK